MRFWKSWLAIALVALLAVVAVNAFAPIEVVDIQTEVASVDIADAAEVSIEGVTVAVIEIPAIPTDTLANSVDSAIPTRAISTADTFVFSGIDHRPGINKMTGEIDYTSGQDSRPSLDAFGDGGIL